jgi:hypothetical protein
VVVSRVLASFSCVIGLLVGLRKLLLRYKCSRCMREKERAELCKIKGKTVLYSELYIVYCTDAISIKSQLSPLALVARLLLSLLKLLVSAIFDTRWMK